MQCPLWEVSEWSEVLNININHDLVYFCSMLVCFVFVLLFIFDISIVFGDLRQRYSDA